MNSLFEPTHLGGLRLQNRVVMAPLTRNRADPMGVPAPYAGTTTRSVPAPA